MSLNIWKPKHTKKWKWALDIQNGTKPICLKRFLGFACFVSVGTKYFRVCNSGGVRFHALRFRSISPASEFILLPKPPTQSLNLSLLHSSSQMVLRSEVHFWCFMSFFMILHAYFVLNSDFPFCYYGHGCYGRIEKQKALPLEDGGRGWSWRRFRRSDGEGKSA